MAKVACGFTEITPFYHCNSLDVKGVEGVKGLSRSSEGEATVSLLTKRGVEGIEGI